MIRVVLKRTKKKPSPSIVRSGETFVSGYTFLYTDTGYIKDWDFAMRLFIPNNSTVPEEVEIEISIPKEASEEEAPTVDESEPVSVGTGDEGENKPEEEPEEKPEDKFKGIYVI